MISGTHAAVSYTSIIFVVCTMGKQVEMALFDCLYVILNISYSYNNDMYNMRLDMMLAILKQYYF